MLRVQGADFSTLEKSHPFVKIFNEAFECLDLLGLSKNARGNNIISIQEAKRKESFDADGNKQHSMGCYIQCTQRYQHKGVTYRLEYYDSITYDGKIEKLLPMQFGFDGTVLELSNEPKDKQFMFLFADPQCEKVPELTEYQNEISYPAQYSIVMREKDTKSKIKSGRERVELESMLYDLENNHDKLMFVCYNMNIPTENRKDFELVENLINIVLQKDARGNYNRDIIDRFKAAITPETPADTQLANIKAFVGELIDSGLVIPHGGTAGSWYLDQEKTQKVCGWRAGTDKKDALLNYFITHKQEIPVYKEKLLKLNPS